MADNKEVLGLDLDVTDFKEGLASAKEGLSTLGVEGAESLGVLSKILFDLGPTIIGIGVAALALKTTFDLVFEGDQIKRTNDLFNSLAQNFGLAGDSLKENLLKAAGGMADTTSVLDAANKAMIGLGQNSSMIPKIMEVARKTTLAFGGDLVENFQKIAMGVTTGNQRMLRTSGIVIDTKKAMEDYARSLGGATDELTESGRQQAIFNAVMGFSSKNLKSVNVDLDNSTTSWIRFKTEVKEVGDIVAIVVNKIFGPTVSALIKSTASVIHDAATTLKAEFGSGAEQASSKMEILTNRLASFTKAKEQLEQKKGLFGFLADALFIHKGADALEKINKGIADTQAAIAKANADSVAETAKTEGAKTAITKAATKERDLDMVKHNEAEMKLREEVLKIQEKAAADSVKLANNEEKLNTARLSREKLAEQQAALDKEKNKKNLASSDEKVHKDAAKKDAAIDLELKNKKIQYLKDYNKEHATMLQNQLNDSKNVMDGIANAAAQSSDKAKQSFQNAGTQGAMIFGTLQKAGTSAFESLGKAIVDHSQSASDMMKSLFLGALATMVTQEGEWMLAKSVYPPDPAGLAAGAGLLALGGAISAMAGSAGGSSSMSSGGGGGGSSGGGATSSAAAAASPQAAAATPTGALTVNIQGDYLNTQETQRTLLQAVRDATDQTGFQYLQIGQTGAQSY